ncbi:putative glucan endo-1,3-beta-D-glucosidase [Arabidopsis thaliana]
MLGSRVVHQLFFLILTLILPFSAAYQVGVNYGTVANNLPPPHQVVNFIKTKTIINHVKIFDTNHDILAAFSGITGISLTVTVPNSDIISLSKLSNARSWLSDNLLPFLPTTSIRYIAVGNEVVATSDKTLITHLLPAMETLTLALHLANVSRILVSTPHSLGILSGSSEPPSSGKFRKGYDKAIFSPILDFHNRTKSSFMVNPYPYFGFGPETLNYALFNTNDVVYVDPVTKLNYTNMFDAQLDATGWPSAGEPNQTGVGLDYAAAYNGNLIKHVNSGKGTPLMPNWVFETYVFSLFNENLKSSVSEQNFGLFKPDFTPVYDVGIMKTNKVYTLQLL